MADRFQQMKGDQMRLTQWPQADRFPASAPNEGVRMDRHRTDGFQYKIWVSGPGELQSAIYRRHEADDEGLGQFLEIVQATLTEVLGQPDDDPSQPALSVDVMATPGPTYDSLAFGYDVERQSELVRDELLREALEDIEQRLKAEGYGGSSNS